MSRLTPRTKQAARARRHARIRAKVAGSAARPRLALFHSNRAFYAQLIDDDTGTTIASSDSRGVHKAGHKARAAAVGIAIAEKAKDKGIIKVVFDRGGFRYTGAVRVFADAARASGLAF